MLVFLTQRLLWPLTRLGETFDLYQRAMASLHRILDVTDLEPQLSSGDEPATITAATTIAFKDVHFGYRTGAPLFQGLTLDVAGGCTTAVVGATGSGKTTLIKLLLRFFDPDQGCVQFDGTHATAFHLQQLREHMQFEITNLAHNLGITTVYVTHDQTEALTMSDRVAVFDDGRIQQLAPPDELYEAPTNSFVAQFIGENNTLMGTVKEMNNGTAVVQLDDGELIDTVPVNVGKVGDRTLVSIRPERVEFNKDRLQPGAHTVKAEVLEFIYMGDIYRTRLRVAGNDDFIIKTRNAPDQRRLEPGEQIEIGWRPQDCRALDA